MAVLVARFFVYSWEGAGAWLGGSSCRGNIGFAAEVVALVLFHKPQRQPHNRVMRRLIPRLRRPPRHSPAPSHDT